MREIPPEIDAIVLPTGYTWRIYVSDPVIHDRSGSAVAWVNCEGVPPDDIAAMAIYIVETAETISYKDHQPPLTVVDLCKILAAHVWLMERT